MEQTEVPIDDEDIVDWEKLYIGVQRVKNLSIAENVMYKQMQNGEISKDDYIKFDHKQYVSLKSLLRLLRDICETENLSDAKEKIVMLYDKLGLKYENNKKKMQLQLENNQEENIDENVGLIFKKPERNM